MKIKVFILTLFFFSITVEPACNSTTSIPKHKMENKISKFDMAVELIKQKKDGMTGDTNTMSDTVTDY